MFKAVVIPQGNVQRFTPLKYEMSRGCSEKRLIFWQWTRAGSLNIKRSNIRRPSKFSEGCENPEREDVLHLQRHYDGASPCLVFHCSSFSSAEGQNNPRLAAFNLVSERRPLVLLCLIAFLQLSAKRLSDFKCLFLSIACLSALSAAFNLPHIFRSETMSQLLLWEAPLYASTM